MFDLTNVELNDSTALTPGDYLIKIEYTSYMSPAGVDGVAELPL